MTNPVIAPRAAIGVVTEFIGANESGQQFLRDLKSGNF